MFIYNLQEMAKNLQSDYQKLSSKIEHNGLKGTIREDKLKEYLSKLFPTKYAIGNGVIVDANETQSRQQDFIIYDNFNSPKLMETESVQVIPIESVYATIEVKSTLTVDELEKSIKNIESVKKLEKTKPFSSPLIISSIIPPICMIFAYSSDTSLNNIVKKIDEFNNSIDIKNRLSIVCILDKGLIFGINRHGFKEIEIVPTDNTILVTHEDKLENNLYLFYLLMMTAINNIVMPPVNLMGYAEKIKKADYSGTVSNDRIIPDDAYLDLGNGIHTNLKLMKEIFFKTSPLLEKFKQGAFTKNELLEYIVTVLYERSIDPNFTGNPNESYCQGLTFLDIQVSSHELKLIKQYYYKEIEMTEELDTLINKLYNRYTEIKNLN
ncbi:MAG: DUF6602 domain-containing protein [Clostridia bacterium]